MKDRLFIHWTIKPQRFSLATIALCRHLRHLGF